MAIFCIIDGMTDADPFSFEPYPNLRVLLERGAHGFFQTTPQGMSADTLPCTLTLLGLPEEQIPPAARTCFEAVACNIPVKQSDLLLRCNLVKLDEEGRLISSSAGDLRGEQAQRLAVRYHLQNIGGYKNILVIPNAADRRDSVVTFPPHQCIGELLEEKMAAGLSLPQLVRRSRSELFPYLFWPWAPSVATQLPKIKCKAAAVCGTQIIKGIAKAAGFAVPVLRNATGDTDTDLIEKADTALALSQKYPLVFLHINGADEAAHRLDGVGKRAFLQKIDSLVISRLAQARQPVLITSDHGCCPKTGRHLAIPQPFILDGTLKSGDLGCFAGNKALALLTGKEEVLWQK
jgi:2,3-bisphosphoglycerate-independent phosphoglycerate mutase